MKYKVLVFLFALALTANTQTLPVPADIGSQHPRVFGADMQLAKVKSICKSEEWAAAVVAKTKNNLDKYIPYYKKDKTWLVSRLQMYWKTKSTQVYINGGTYARAEGQAPVATVKYPGTRNHITDYLTPKLEDVLPYMDDPRGLYLQHKERKDTWEWTAISKTGKIVESLNRQILGLARDAAFVYWYNGDKMYGDIAYSILDTYLQGIYYREEPIDLSHGHHQTLVGYTSFEVIQEHNLNEVTQCYDFLHGYITAQHPDKLDTYAQTLQKWADLIIKNGVSFNNWNLLEAAHISNIALVLENNSAYKNGRGAQYYLDQIMNQTSTRQWSMNKLIDYGYDPKTGIWNESPGYSMNVLSDFIHFAEFYDRNFNIDLLSSLPILKHAVKSTAQYLYPNKYMVAFGDGHYGKLRAEPIIYLIKNAQKFSKQEDEVYFTRMLKTIYDEDIYSNNSKNKTLADLFSTETFTIKKDIAAGSLSDFTVPLFYAPNTSWLVQRHGDAEGGLMISQIGSLGNHMHSNGIAMELYGKGLPLAPEMGHGYSYFSIEYAEYYTQFPAHNTVIVNGRSKYPEMKSSHGFDVVASYPQSGQKDSNVPGITFSDITFLEPETNSNQRRVMGIIQNENTGGYYIDIFRSGQNKGDDKKHEYFFHNLGQSLKLKDTKGNTLDLKPTTKLAFGDGDLMAYDYMWDKKAVETEQDFTGQFSLAMKDRTVNMNLWMQGQQDREIFSVLSPKSTAFRHGPLPEEFNDLPIPTLVVRQNGEAWNRPFVAVYEPALNGESSIKAVDYFGSGASVGIHVISNSGKEDYIFSNTLPVSLSKEKFSVNGTYGIISTKVNDVTLFLGNGKSISNGSYKIMLESDGQASLVKENDMLFFNSTIPSVLTIPSGNTIKNLTLTTAHGKVYKGEYDKKDKTISFRLPATDYQQITISLK